MSFSVLPDLCTLSIFDRIPLQQMKPLGQVCRRWATLLPVAYNRHRSLILFISPRTNFTKNCFKYYCTDQYRSPFSENTNKSYLGNKKFYAQNKWTLLEYSTFTENDSKWLISSLPNITNLVIKHDGLFVQNERKLQIIKETTRLMTLLNHWSGKLVSLHYSQADSVFDSSLFDAINAMPTLKRLWLELNFGSRSDLSQIDLSVLAQLDQFYIRSHVGDLTDTFQKYASVMSPNLKIAIGNSISEENVLENYLEFDNQLAKRFVQCQFLLDFNLLQQFYSKFLSLTDVSVNVHNVTLSQLCLGLSPLKALNQLHFNTKQLTQSVNPFNKEDHLPSSNFAPFTSVHTLHLSCNVNSHLDLHSIHLPRIFPAVIWINVSHLSGRCDICKIENSHRYRLVIRKNERYQSCFQQLLQPYRMLNELENVIEYI